ncbi:hypothetical protein ACFLV5_01895 [Chloroflexota bacterium]
MGHAQLYYPNINPSITAKLAISLLHWDKVVRIFPGDYIDEMLPRHGIIKTLEDEGILTYEAAGYEDVNDATKFFEELVSISEDEHNPQQSAAKTLVRPLSGQSKRGDYYLYEGKLGYGLGQNYPKYFRVGSDRKGNRVYLCSKQTGVTYMTILAYLLNQQSNYTNTITDYDGAFPLFVALDRLLQLPLRPGSIDFVPVVDTAKQVETIFYMPLLKVLEPAGFGGDRTIEQILKFRQDKDNDNLRKEYLVRIDNFMSELKKCGNDAEVKEVVNKHDKKFQTHLKAMIDACKQNRIPVNEKVVSHGRRSGWSVISRLWDATSKVIDVISLNKLGVIKPLLGLKPSLNYYEEVLKEHDDFYPLLIAETFAPTRAQQLYHQIQRLDKIELKLR